MSKFPFCDANGSVDPKGVLSAEARAKILDARGYDYYRIVQKAEDLLKHEKMEKRPMAWTGEDSDSDDDEESDSDDDMLEKRERGKKSGSKKKKGSKKKRVAKKKKSASSKPRGAYRKPASRSRSEKPKPHKRERRSRKAKTSAKRRIRQLA